MGKSSRDSITSYEIFKNINNPNGEAGLKTDVSVHFSKTAFRLKFVLYFMVSLMAVCFSFILLYQI